MGAGVLGLVVTATPAVALQGTVPSNVAPSWQTNGAVSAITSANGIVYVGGDFTSVRPPGAAAGSGEVARNRLAAFNASTGALITSFNPNVNASVKVLSMSADGQTLYAGGDFTTVGATTRNRIAAFTAATGALTSWNPNANGRVSGIAATASTIYVAGAFSTVGGRTERRTAALSASTGAALATFTTTPDNVVYQIALTPQGDKLYLAGAFLSVNGDTSYHSAAVVDTATGATLPLPAASVIPPKTEACIVEAKSVKTDSTSAYFGVEGTGGGCFDGTFAVNSADGSLRWQSRCLGATQAVQPIGAILYTGAHSHDCTADQDFDPDSFPEVGWAKGLSRHLLSRTTSGGLLAAWNANTNGGPNGAGLGPRVMATDGNQLFLGGEFTTVNGLIQQGFARFSPATGDLTAPTRPPAPTVVARAGGKVSIFVQAPLDTDDTDLTVRLYRDGASTPIATAPAHSLFWKQPVLAFSDDGLALGSSHTYTADAIEAFGSKASPKSSASRAVTVVTAPSAYEAAVAQDSPVLNWRLGDAAGPLTADSSASKNAGLAFGGAAVSYGTAGAVAGNTAITVNGSTGYVSSTAKQDSPSSFSVETWFKTTSTTGGKIIGFGDQQGGLDFNGNPTTSGSYDKQIYLTNDGRLAFGVWVGFADVLTSSTAYNDGQWHHVVGSQGPQGLTLYVDGAKTAHDGQTQNQAYSGYWRIGGDSLGGWPNQPASNFFAGAIDETAVYDHALSLTSVQNHYAASGRALPPAPGPTDAYGQAVYNDAPATYWRLDETSGATAADSSDNGSLGNYVGGVVQGVAGALGAAGHAATFDGVSGNVALSSPRGGPSVYSTELWFKSSTASGGKLVGFGNAQTGMSSNYDKQVYLTNDGRLVFGVYNNGFDTVYSPPGLADGQWHQVVATQGPAGMRLYVDDNLVGSNAASANQAYGGYWRVGGDNLNAWPDQPSSAYFAGTIDEVAIYDSVLSAAQVDAHYSASGRSGPDTLAPTTSITAPTDGAAVTTGAVTVTATASDNLAVTSLDLQVDGATVSTSTTAPYTFSWTATSGPHTLRTVAHDAAGNTGTSADVHVTASAPDTTNPTAAITSPADGASVSGPTTVTATATDDTGVTSVDLLVDGVVLASSTTAPYSFSWSATSVGDHTLQARAHDGAGNTATSSTVTVTVPPDTTAPGAPGTPSASDVTASAATLSWTAATDDRGVSGYQVLRDGVVVGTPAGLSFTDTGLGAGTTYSYTVRAVDAAANVGPASAATPVTTQPANAVLFSDTWTAADGAPWSPAWTVGASNGTVSTQSGAGQLAVTDVANSYGRAQLTGLAARADSELLTSYSWSSNTALSYLSVYLRGSGGWQNAYRPRNGYGLQLQSNSGTVTVQKNVNGVTSTVQSVAGAQAVTTGKQWLRLRVSGSTIQFKVWTDGATEPVAWESTSTDTSVTAAGQLFLSVVRGGTNVGAKAVSFDDLAIRDAQ
ncbi:MAG: LamG-like jellyroll fold domain-containing protein [Jatrophihabitantaceae bacterium]